MFEIEFICNLDGFIKIQHLTDISSGIIGMASLVNTSALHHHEETLLGILHHEINGSLRYLREPKVSLFLINGV